MTLGAGEIRDLMAAHGLAPSRALGQNFVADPNTVRRIARIADVGPGDRVVEIGAGLGSLTLALAEAGAAVTAVEVDRHLLPVLRTVVEPAGVRVVAGDAMKLDWTEVLAGPSGRERDTEPAGAGSWVLVANLPYNIATPLVADLLDEVPAIGRMLAMVQKEVAERLAAAPGSRSYGAVSVKVAYWATARVVAQVPAGVFIPRPNVDSALVSIERRQRPAVDPAEVAAGPLFSVVRAGFAQRRKTLRRALSGVVAPEALAGEKMWDAARVAPSARAEQLDVAAWGRLAAAATTPEAN